MGPLTTAVMRAVEAALTIRPVGWGSAEVQTFAEVDKVKGLRDGYAGAPPGTLYLELRPEDPTTRFLWAELLEAGASPPMTLITPGEGNGASVLLSTEGIELHIMEDGAEPGTFVAQLYSSDGKPSRWTFQRC